MSKEAIDLLRAIKAVGGRYERMVVEGGVTGLCVPELPAEARKDFLAGDLWEGRGEMLKPGSRTTVTGQELGGVRYVLKQYKRVALRRRLRYAVMRTRSFQSWEQGQLMVELGFPVARPLAVLVERSWGVPGRSKLLMEAVEGVSIRDVLDREDGMERLRGARPHLEEFFVRMREHRLIHGDLSGSNIVLDEENRPRFIDLDGGLLLRSERAFLRKRGDDMRQFMKNFREYPEAAELFRELEEEG